MRRNLIKTVLALGDYLLMTAALAVMLWARYGYGELSDQFSSHISSFFLVFIIWVGVFYILDLYNINAPFNHQYFVTAVIVNIALAAGFYYAFPGLSISPKRNLIIIAAAYIPMFYAWRFIMNRIIDFGGSIRSVAIIGSDEQTLDLIGSIQRKTREGFRVAVVLPNDPDRVPEAIASLGVTVASSVAALKEFVIQQSIGTVIISSGWYDRVYRDLYELVSLRVRFYQLTTFWEQFNETIPIYATHEGWFLENLNQGPVRFYTFLKRGLDFFFSLVLLPIFIPLGVLTGLLVFTTSKGPALFRQVRVGRNGREFTIYKFRSMVVDAEKDGARWASANDPRVTRVGRFIRTTRLDEIPQIINVLRGDMSFIGPRPERPEFVRELSTRIPHYSLRLMVKPGLTGWAQVKLGYTSTEEESAEKLTYDLYYVKNMSFVLDFKILLKTVLTVVSRQGR